MRFYRYSQENISRKNCYENKHKAQETYECASVSVRNVLMYGLCSDTLNVLKLLDDFNIWDFTYGWIVYCCCYTMDKSESPKHFNTMVTRCATEPGCRQGEFSMLIEMSSRG